MVEVLDSANLAGDLRSVEANVVGGATFQPH